jgi:hypothetical protein
MLKKATFSPAQPRRAKTRRSAGKAAAYESILPNQLNSREDLWLKSLMSMPINFSSTLGRLGAR